MENIYQIFLSTAILSLISFIGVFAMGVKGDWLKGATMAMVALSAGTLLGDSFLHLMPEAAAAANGSLFVWFSFLSGIILFFILEKIVCWRHCHVPTSEEHPHPVGIMNLVGDGLHNFLDGIIIAGSFFISPALGWITAAAVFAHEIPQEISDFGVLIHAGYSRARALLLNFFSALLSFLGAGAFIVLGGMIENLTSFIIPFTAGGFIYIATADLIPELHKETKAVESLKQLFWILSGIGLMWALKIAAE